MNQDFLCCWIIIVLFLLQPIWCSSSICQSMMLSRLWLFTNELACRCLSFFSHIFHFFVILNWSLAKCLSEENGFDLSNSQAENLAEFYEFCKQLELARTFQFPTLRQVSYFVCILPSWFRGVTRCNSQKSRSACNDRNISVQAYIQWTTKLSWIPSSNMCSSQLFCSHPPHSLQQWKSTSEKHPAPQSRLWLVKNFLRTKY